MSEVVELEHAHRTIPQNRLRLEDDFLPIFQRLRTGIHTFPTVGNVENIDHLLGRLIRKFATCHRLHRQTQVHTLFLGSRHHAESLFHQVVFVKRKTDFSALRLDEREAHSTADNQVIDLVEQVLDDSQFRTHFRATDDGREGMLGIFQHVVDGNHLFLHQQTEHFRVFVEIIGDDSRRSVLAMRRSECVVHIDVGIRSECLGELFLRCFHRVLGLVILRRTFFHTHGLALFFGVETKVFKQQNLTRFQRSSLFSGLRTVGCKAHGNAQSLLHILANLSEREFRVHLSFRFAHMAHQNERTAVAEDFLQRRQGTTNTGVVGDYTIFVEWHVEINAHDCLFTSKIKFVNCHHLFTFLFL